MAVYSSPSIPLDGLIFSIDAGNAKSYSGSGTNVLDPINNISGVMNNGVGFSTSIGGYFSFDGTDDKILYPLNSAYDISQSITIEAHIRPTSYPTAGGGGMIITKVASYYLEFVSNGKIRVYFAGVNSPGYHESVGTLFLNVWNHVAVTRDFANNTINIYINGVLDRTISGITGNITVQQSFALSVGGYSAGGYLFVGHIACGKIYNRALTAQEMLQNYNALKDRYIYREEYTKSNLLLNIDFQTNNSYTASGTSIVDLAKGLIIPLSQTSYLTYSSSSPKSLRFGRTMPPASLNGAYCSILIPAGSLSGPIYLGNDHTTEIWFKINDINPTNNDATEVMSSLFVYQGYHNMFYYSDTLFFYNVWYKQASVNYPVSAEVTVGNANAEILPNVWYQAIATKTSSIIKLYINGSLKATATIPYTTISDNVTNYLNISTAVPLPSGTAFKWKSDCTIGAIRMYNRALTPLEVSYNFNALRGRFGI
jgi:hypothetical protein